MKKNKTDTADTYQPKMTIADIIELNLLPTPETVVDIHGVSYIKLMDIPGNFTMSLNGSKRTVRACLATTTDYKNYEKETALPAIIAIYTQGGH